MPRVLVIDDESTILENIKFVLELEEYTVLTASDGEEGIKIFSENISNIDVVITDIRIPKLSGMGVLKKVKKLMPEMNVIVITGHGDMNNAILAMKEGAFEYLRKPVNADDLMIAINNAINKKNLLQENARMQKELLEQNQYLKGLHDSAQIILMNMVPKGLPTVPGFAFSAEYKCSDAVGGDMYDVYDIGDYLCVCVFDVSSHGILAAVITVLIKSFIQNIEYNYSHGIYKKSFSDIVSDLNRELGLNTAQNVFATLFLGFIEKKTKKLYYVSAGHITQYIMSGNDIIPLPSTGTVLGAFEEASFGCSEVQLRKEDKVVLFTDGITEAPSDNDIFGVENVISILNNNKKCPINNVVKTILNAASEFAGGNFTDDVTILGIEILD